MVKQAVFKDTIFLRWVGLVIAIVLLSHLLTFWMLGVDTPPVDHLNQFPPHHEPPPLPKLFWLGAFLQFCGVVYIVWLGSRVLVRPIQNLANAAHQFSLVGGQSFRPLAEIGPIETQQAAQVFNQMAQRIQAQVEQKQQFLLAISHDVRTPLTRMKLRIEQLHQFDHPDAQTLQQKLTDDIHEMSHLLDQTLSYFRPQYTDGFRHVLSAPSYMGLNDSLLLRERIDITALLQALVDDSQELGLAVQFLDEDAAPSLIVDVDCIAIKRCLNNLMDNALRYAGSAQLKLVEHAETIEIQVIDYGKGIPEHLLVQVTQPFVRLEVSRNLKTGGFGLGLAIAKQIVEDHSGQ